MGCKSPLEQVSMWWCWSKDHILSSKALKSESVLHGLNLFSGHSVTMGPWLVHQNPVSCGLILPCFSFYSRLLLRIPLYSFSMVLVDKHGMDKERFVSLVTPVTLFNLVDTFPLRKEEMVLQAEMGQSCTTWCNVHFSAVSFLSLHSATCLARP